VTAPILNNLGMGGGERRVLLKNGSVALDTNGDVIIIPAGKDPEECPCCDAGCTGTGDPCVDCDWGTHLVDPQDAVTTGATNDDETWCTSIPDSPFFSYSEDSDTCSWVFSGNDLNSATIITVYYAKTNGNNVGACPTPPTIDTGEWGISLFVEDISNPTSYAEWAEKTTGFCCDASTNTINGEHEFSAGPCDGSACGGTPKVVVAVTP